MVGRRLEQGAVRIGRLAGGGDIVAQEPLQIVMPRNLVFLGTFFVQAHPSAAVEKHAQRGQVLASSESCPCRSLMKAATL